MIASSMNTQMIIPNPAIAEISKDQGWRVIRAMVALSCVPPTMPAQDEPGNQVGSQRGCLPGIPGERLRR